MAGLVAGDTIVEIDGVDVRTTSAEEVVKMIHDRKGQGSKYVVVMHKGVWPSIRLLPFIVGLSWLWSLWME